MRTHWNLSFFIAASLLFVGGVRAETITCSTYNIEWFHQHFPPTARETGDKAISQRMKMDADKALWLIAQTIQDTAYNPDILVIEECCDQDELDSFNKKWLGGSYETVIVFPGNSDVHQSVAFMAKPGFKVLEKRDQYYLEKDPGGGNERGDKLFARGPAFLKVQSPGGATFWVGGTHEKSKHGDSVETTKWRLREATRLHQIAKECEKAGPAQVVLMGDMNDELYFQEYELEAGADTIATMVGPASDGFILATKPLIDAGKISFGGYWENNFRSFIDDIILSSALKNNVQEVNVFYGGMARAASDHYPVYVKLKM